TEGGDSTATATATTPAAPKTPASTNEIAVITLKCRGLNLTKYSPTANNDLAYAVQKELQESPLFDRKETKLSGDIESVDESSVTFSYGVKLKLKRPRKLRNELAQAQFIPRRRRWRGTGVARLCDLLASYDETTRGRRHR